MNDHSAQINDALGPMAPISPAPWRGTFLTHLNTLDIPLCVLSTLHCEPTSSNGPLSHIKPRGRTVVFRGMWASLPVHPQNPALLNPQAYESDLLCFSSDARMEKIAEITYTGDGHKSSNTGGGPVEVVFWINPTRTQWRIRGRCHVLGQDVDSGTMKSQKKIIHEHMRPTGLYGEDWELHREVTAHFGNLSPGMRGSFKNPAPGTPLNQNSAPEYGLGQKVTDLHDPVARKNFCVLVVIPEEVDRLDLLDSEEGKRWKYQCKKDTWETIQTWP